MVSNKSLKVLAVRTAGAAAMSGLALSAYAHDAPFPHSHPATEVGYAVIVVCLVGATMAALGVRSWRRRASVRASEVRS